MSKADVKEKLFQFFQNNILYNESVNEIDGDESLIDSGYIDSTGIIGLVTFIEKAYNIRVNDNEILPENFDTINCIYNYICGKIEN